MEDFIWFGRAIFYQVKMMSVYYAVHNTKKKRCQLEENKVLQSDALWCVDFKKLLFNLKNFPRPI